METEYVTDSLFTYPQNEYFSDTTYSGGATDLIIFSSSGQMTATISVQPTILNYCSFRVSGNQIISPNNSGNDKLSSNKY